MRIGQDQKNPETSNHSLYPIKLHNCSSYPEGNFGGNQLLARRSQSFHFRRGPYLMKACCDTHFPTDIWPLNCIHNLCLNTSLRTWLRIGHCCIFYLLTIPTSFPVVSLTRPFGVRTVVKALGCSRNLTVSPYKYD